MSDIFLLPNPETGKFPENTIGVVFHGGGGKALSYGHPLVQFLHTYVALVVSLELPNHGNRQTDTIYESDPMTALNDIKEKLTPHISGKKVYFAAYSMGGILLFRLLPFFLGITHEDSMAVFFGIGVRPQLTNWTTISNFWQPQHFINTNGVEGMAKLHGPNWQLTIRSVHSWLLPNSPVWLPPEIVKELVCGERKNVFFICGTDKLEPFDLDDVIEQMDKKNVAIRVNTVPCGHWTYFSTHWKIVQQVLSTIFLIHGKLSRVPDTISKL